jgi:hypothetical protein
MVTGSNTNWRELTTKSDVNHSTNCCASVAGALEEHLYF